MSAVEGYGAPFFSFLFLLSLNGGFCDVAHSVCHFVFIFSCLAAVLVSMIRIYVNTAV